jgi:hypothetical protein
MRLNQANVCFSCAHPVGRFRGRGHTLPGYRARRRGAQESFSVLFGHPIFTNDPLAFATAIFSTEKAIQGVTA